MPIYEEAPENTFDPDADVEDGGWREVSRTAGKDGGPVETVTRVTRTVVDHKA